MAKASRPVASSTFGGTTSRKISFLPHPLLAPTGHSNNATSSHRAHQSSQGGELYSATSCSLPPLTFATRRLVSLAYEQVWLRATTPANVRGGAKVPHTTPHLHHSHPYPHAPAAPQPLSAASAKHPAGAFIRSITDGVFKSIKSSSYVHPKGPYSSSRLGARPSTILLRRPPAPTRFGAGSGARPSFQRPSTTQLGLGAARNFSAGQGVFANVVQNVPLGLRTLGGVGVDERKWKGVRRGVRKEMKREGGEQMKNVGGSRLWMSKQAEMDLYFTAPATVTEVASEQAQDQEELPTRLPVVLIIDVEPELSFISTSSSPSSSALLDPTWRLLTPSVISHFSTITTSYESHAHRIRALHHRLLDAGVFDDQETQTSLEVWRAHDGREVKEVLVTFGAEWDVRDVRNVVGWTGGERAGQWCRVIDLEEERESRMRESEELASASEMTATSCSEHEHDSEEIHQAISSTFILPDPYSTSDTTSSLELSPPLSPSPSSCDDTLSWNDWDMQSASGVGVGGDYGEEACHWDDARELAAEEEQRIVSSGLSRSYEEEVRSFLGQLDRF